MGTKMFRGEDMISIDSHWVIAHKEALNMSQLFFSRKALTPLIRPTIVAEKEERHK